MGGRPGRAADPEIGRLRNGASEGTITIVEYEAPRRIVFRGRMGKMEPTVIHTVEADDGGSRFSRSSASWKTGNQ